MQRLRQSNQHSSGNSGNQLSVTQIYSIYSELYQTICMSHDDYFYGINIQEGTTHSVRY